MPGPTPEDRLLEIIENPPKQANAQEPSAAAVRVKDLASLAAFIRAFDLRAWWQTANLGHFTKFIMAVSAVLTIACAWNFKGMMEAFDAKFAAIIVPGNPKEDVIGDSPRNVDFQQMLTLAKEHNIFSLSRDAASVEGLFVGDGQETAGLKLVGILWSDNPQAMVENTVDQKTLLLSVGDQVSRLTVKAITKDKVVLSRDDRVWELR
jgi:hypothetical protein